MLWLAVHYPALALEVFSHSLEEDPQAVSLQKKTAKRGEKSTKKNSTPRVVVEQNRIVQMNNAARACGVLQGSTLATANAITGALCHDVRDPAAEAARLKALAEALYQLTPQVAMASKHTLVLNIQASLRLFGNAQVISEQALRLSRTLGHKAQARLSTTPAAAEALARSNANTLNELPLTALTLDTTIIERFHNMGFKQLGPVLKLPDPALARRFGKATLDYLRRLRGDLPDPQRFIEPTATFDRQQTLLEPIRHKAGLLFPMRRQLHELRQWLLARQLAMGAIRWTFHNSQHNSVELQVCFSEPQQAIERPLALSRLQLERIELPEAVLNLALSAERLVPCRHVADELFQELIPALKQQAPSELVDELRARLGATACRFLQALPQHHPDWLSYRRLKPTKALQSDPEAAADTRHYRPLWLCRPPQPVAREQLELLQGPERIRTAWWHKGIERNYFIARYHRKRQVPTAHCWAFSDQQGCWFIQGYFA